MLEISALRAFGDDGYIVGRDVVPENLIDSARPWLTDCSQNNRRQTSTMAAPLLEECFSTRCYRFLRSHLVVEPGLCNCSISGETSRTAEAIASTDRSQHAAAPSSAGWAAYRWTDA